MTKIGAHVTGHPRDHYGMFCPAKPAVIISLDDGGALQEAKMWSEEHTITIFRDTSVYLEAPGDINNPPGTYKQMAEYWYPQLKAKWVLNPADYYTITNEQGGGGDDLQAMRNLVAYEREVMRLANQDGLSVCILNLAGGSPDPIQVWEDEFVPFIREAFEGGNIYGRHAYEDNWNRVAQEADYLENAGLGYGGLAVTEWGFDGGYGQIHNVDQIKQQDQDYRPYGNIIGFCIWELGTTEFDANWDHLIPQLDDWMYDNPTPSWQPGTPPGNKSRSEFLWDESVKEQIARGIPLNPAAALQQEIAEEDRNVVHREITPVYDGEGYTIQAGERLDGSAPRKVYVWRPSQPIWSFYEPNPTPTDPLAGFQIGAPFRVPFILTSGYAVPRDYDGDGVFDDLHEGADYDIIGGVLDSKEPVICGVDGVVKATGFSPGAYGWRTIIETSHNRHQIFLWYAHKDSSYVSVGDQVKRGDHLGELGDTGGSWSEHVHINMQVPGLGSNDPRFVIPDTVNPHKYMSLIPTPPSLKDLATYFFPRTGNYGDIVILANSWGQGDERQQLQRVGNASYVTKNQLWELRHITPNFINLVLDISRGGGEFYTVQGNWLPRMMMPGETFSRVENVSVYQFTCNLVASYTSASDIIFADHFNSKVINGFTLSNVARFLWKINGVIEEEYWYAEGLGLVQWLARDGRKSHITELIPLGQQANNSRQEHPCGF